MKLLHLLFTSTLTSTLSLTALGAVQRDLSFLPSAKEKTLVHSTGDVCKVGMWKKTILPYDREIEWIESNGSSWIDTGVPLASPFEIDVDFLLPILGNGFWMGEFYSNKRFYILYQFVGFGSGYGTSNSAGSVTPVANTKYHAHSVLRNGEQYITIDGSYSYHTYVNEDVNNGNNLFVGKFMNQSNPKIRIYNGMKVWQGGQLKGDFVTCLKDGKGELYNKVTSSFCERHGDMLIPQ